MDVAVADRGNSRLCESQHVKLAVNLNPVLLEKKYTTTGSA